MSVSTETRPFVKRIINLLRKAAIRVASLAAQLAHHAHQLDEWMNQALGQGALHEILDAILAAIQEGVTSPILKRIVAEIRAFHSEGRERWAAA